MTLTGVVSQDFLSMSGTYSYGVFCGNGDSGPWTGTRTPSSTSTISSITSAASYEQNQVAAGGYVSIFGTGLADGIHYSTGAPYPTVLGTTEIFACATQTFNTSTCTAAGVAFASPGQVNVVLAGIGPTVQVLQSPTMYFVARVGGVVDAASGAGTPTPVTILPFAPSVFIAGNDCPMTAAAPNCVVNTGTAPNGRATRGVITDANGNLVWSENPARLGQSYTAWVTGLGSIKSGVRPSPAVQMTFLDVPAFGYPNPSYGIVAVTYAGAVPQFPGLYQINFQIPLTIGEGPDGYGAWPCGNYGWDLTLAINVGTYPTSNAIQIPLVIKSGDVACKP